jgi:hypothetical protein
MTRAQFTLLATWLCRAAPASLRGRLMAGDRERGDIPGWVMIAIMSAAVVVVLIPLVGPTIAHAFTSAINNVSNTQSSSGGGN